jgi:hypothetical protein
MGIGIKFKRAGNNTTLNLASSIKDPKRYIDWICELQGITMGASDSLTVSWNITVYLSCNGKTLDSKPIQISQTFFPKKNINVKFVRFVHYKNKSKIYIYNKMPKVGFPRKVN